MTVATIEAYLKSLVESGRIDDLLRTTNGMMGWLMDYLRILGMSNEEGAITTFGDDSFDALYGLRDALNNGLSMSTSVVVRPFDEDEEPDEEMAEYIASLGYDVEDVNFFEVSVVISDGTSDFGSLHELTSEITFVLCEVSEPAEGYEREFIVIRQHDGVSEKLSADKYYIKGGKLYVKSDKFSTFAVAFEDTLIPVAPDTGVFASEEKSSAVNVAGISLVAIMAVLTMLGVAIKRKN